MLFLKDPEKLSDSLINSKIYQQFDLLKTNEVFNMLIVGNEGSGKFTLVKTYLGEKFGNEAIQFRPVKLDFQLEGNCEYILQSSFIKIVDFPLIKKDFITIIKNLAETKTFFNEGYHIFIVKHFEKASFKHQASLRRIIEKYQERCRFILLASSLSNIIKPILSRLVVFKINIKYDELKKLNLPISIDIIQSLTSPNLHYIDKLCYIKNMNGRFITYFPLDIIEILFEQINNYIMLQSWSKLGDLRDFLFIIIEKGCNLSDILKIYIKYLLDSSEINFEIIRSNINKNNNMIALISKVSQVQEKMGQIEKDIYVFEYILLLIKKMAGFN
jgi:hypothetical protein